MKTTTREFVTSTQDGKELKIVATYVSELAVSPYLANYPVTKRDYISTSGNMAAYIDGERIKQVSRDPWFWQLIDVHDAPGVKKIWGLPIGFANQEQIDAYNAFLEDLMQDDEEVIAFRAEKKAQDVAKELEHCKQIVSACEHGWMVETIEEVKRLQKQWNDLHNEGGSGYVPTWYPRSAYDSALAYIAKHDNVNN